MYWVLNATYAGGYDHKFDRQLEQTLRRNSSGSGFDLMTGERDIDWIYRRAAAAEKAATKLKAAFGRKLTVTVDGPYEN